MFRLCKTADMIRQKKTEFLLFYLRLSFVVLASNSKLLRGQYREILQQTFFFLKNLT